MTINTTLDEKALKEFAARARRQYDQDPVFIAVHPQRHTESGVYEFEMEIRPDRKQRCFFWRFVSKVAEGQFGMEVSEDKDASADDMVTQWLVARKYLARQARAAAEPSAAGTAPKAPAKRAAAKKATPRKS